MSDGYVLFYYEQFGSVCSGKAPVDDGVIVGGRHPETLRTIPLNDHEAQLTLDQLERLYPYV